MLNLKSKFLAITAALLCAGAAFAQDSGPLIEVLLRKGLINDTEAEDLRAELVKDFVANTPARWTDAQGQPAIGHLHHLDSGLPAGAKFGAADPED